MVKSIKYLMKRSVQSQFERSTSKRADRATNGGVAKKIHGDKYFEKIQNTCDNYAKWLKDNHPEARDMGSAQAHTTEYLQDRYGDNGKSAQTIRTHLSRIFQVDCHTICQTEDLPGNYGFQKNRVETARQVHYNQTIDHLEEVTRALGLRHSELNRLQVRDFKEVDGELLVRGKGKAGRFFTHAVYGAGADYLRDFIQMNSDNPKTTIFDAKRGGNGIYLPIDYNAHIQRAKGACEVYTQAIADGRVTGEIYRPRDGSHRTFDKGALTAVNQWLGHGDDRSYTAVYDYLYGIK